MHDWDGNGKNDLTDDMIEYQMFKEASNYADANKSTHTNGSSNSGNGGLSTRQVLLCPVGGVLLDALFFYILDVDVDSVPSGVVIILWIIFSLLILFAISKKSK
jgi:F0F1-type ATP synthase assembly protein I